MYKRFCLFFVGVSVVLFSLTGVFNMIADPYGIWNLCHIPGFNMYAAKALDVERLTRPVNFIQVRPAPEVVFLGASQVRWAMDADAYEEMTGRSAYNFGIRGMTAYEQRRYVEHIIATDKNLQEIVLGVEMSKFVDGAHFSAPHAESVFSEEEPQLGKHYVIASNLEKTLFSFSVLKGSMESVQENRIRHWTTPYYTATGTIQDAAIMDFFNHNHWRFDRSMMQVQRDGWFEKPKLNEDCMEELRRIAVLCRDHGIRLTMFVLPMHAEGMEAMAGSLDLYGAWLRELLQIAPVWDFCGYNDITQSAVKDGWLREDTNPYFWDSIHPKKNVGRMIMARLLDAPDARKDFGVLLTPDNLDEHLRELQNGRNAWVQVHPESAEEARYYSGFSPVTPLALQDKSVVSARSVVRLDVGSKEQLFAVSLAQKERFIVTGQSMTPMDGEAVTYAMLEDDDGQRLYALASPWESDGLADFMHSRFYAGRGFRIEEPLWDVVPGKYTLYILEVARDGTVYQSMALGTVTVRLQ